MLLPLQGALFYITVHPGRCPGLWAYWAFSPYNWLLNLPSYYFFLLNPYNRHLTHPWLCVYWAFSSLCYVLIQPPSATFPPQLKRSFKYDICIFDRSKLPVERAIRRLARNSWVLRVQHGYCWYTDGYNDLCRECAIGRMSKGLHFTAKRPLLQRKRGRFVMQKGYSNNAKGAWLNAKGASLLSWTITSGVQRSPFLCFEVTEALLWTIKTASGISRIRFSFVIISYCQYNICMVNFGFIRNIEW